MEILSTYWLLFLIVAFVMFGISIALQVKKMKKMGDHMTNFDFDGFGKNMFKGIVPIAICGLSGGLCLILAIIGLVGMFVTGP